MDEIVKQAMAKWPNVPHCYGWLALDARGNWRMRDERAQALQLPGDPIRNATLLAFINRNYTHDAQGRWYFQNGPQRVYVNLEATPYIARTDPVRGYVLHTGEPMEKIELAGLTEDGQLLLQGGDIVALVDDRDTAQCLSSLYVDNAAASDEQLLAWLEGDSADKLTFSFQDRQLPVERFQRDTLAPRFGFQRVPQPDA